MLNSLTFIIRRAGRHWQMLVTLSLGVILATALLASGPILVNTVIEFGLRRALLSAGDLAANLQLSSRLPADAAQYQTIDSQVQQLVQARLGTYLDQVIPSAGVQPVHPWLDQQLQEDQRVTLRFYDTATSRLDERLTFVAGQWPGDLRPDPNVVAVIIDTTMAEAYGLQVGHRLPVSFKNGATTPDLWYEIGGIVQPANSQASYWFGLFNPTPPSNDNRFTALYTVLVPPEAFFPLAADLFAATETNLAWNVLLAQDRIGFADLETLQGQLAALPNALLAIDTDLSVQTSLDQTLAEFTNQATVVRTPLFFLSATVVLLALYYSAMVAALSLSRLQVEFAILRSRGASSGQLLRLQLVEAAIISLAAAISGPLLAYLFVAGLARFGPLADVREASWALHLPGTAWLAALVGAVACIISILWPVPGTLRSNIVTQQQTLSRARPPWWQRLYLDVFFLILGLILLWRLQTAGSIIGGSSDAPQIDWLLLLAPLALLLGSATILLRVFPLLLQLAAQLAARGRGLSTVLALWQAARNPQHITRLVLLLTLAMALGLFSTSLNTTLDRNEVDRSNYAVGSDFRIIDPGFVSITQAQAAPGKASTSAAWRSSAIFDSNRARGNFNIIAVDPASFLAVSQVRPDFAEQPMATLLDELEQNLEGDLLAKAVLPLPGQPSQVGIWVWLPPEQAFYVNELDLTFNLLTEQETIFGIALRRALTDTATVGNWHYFNGDMPQLAADQFPVSLMSVWFRSRTRVERDFLRLLALDSLSVVDGSTGQTVIVADFEAEDQSWRRISPNLNPFVGEGEPHAGAQRLNLRFTDFNLAPWFWYGFSAGAADFSQPLPALVSTTFQNYSQVEPGDIVSTRVQPGGSGVRQTVRFKVVGIVDYFPTMFDQEEGGFLVTLRDPMIGLINLQRQTPIVSNELFVADPAASSQAAPTMPPDLGQGASQILEVDAVRKALKAHPLALGLRSVTLFGYILTTVLSLAGFASYFYMSTRQRAPLYGVLRALGLSPRQLYRTLLLEQAILIISGLTLGTVLGLMLTRLTLQDLSFSLGEGTAVPPFLTETDWGAVAQVYLSLTVAFFISLLLATMLLWRVRIHQVMRGGEE